MLRLHSGERHLPIPIESWLCNPHVGLYDWNGRLIADSHSKPPLNAHFLTGRNYADGRPVSAEDSIKAHPGEQKQALAYIRNHPPAKRTIYGRLRVDRFKRRWLQYWFFSAYNSVKIAGPLRAGDHQGDWELIQIRLRSDDTPELAVYAQHRHAQARIWERVKLLPGTQRPIVYSAKGSHASYFEPGIHWSGAYFDRTDDLGITPKTHLVEVIDFDRRFSWVSWPGRWGGTLVRGRFVMDSESPRGPGRRDFWRDPQLLLEREPGYWQGPLWNPDLG